ncbi:MAG: heavy-metal-associated domain-containing protein [Clostridia bacterium]
MKKEFYVEGMHCEKCAARVENAIKDADAGASVKVNLKKKLVTISVKEPKEDAIYVNAIAEAGYQVL